MQLKIGELIIQVRVLSRSQKHSRHTGTELEALEAEAELIGEDAHRRFWGATGEKGARRLTSVAEGGMPAQEWDVEIPQYSISDSHYVYTLKLTKAENLNIETLGLDDLMLKPYRYEESFSGDALTADAWVLVSEPERNRLLSLMKGKLYFKVVRRGISGEAREMRFGRPIWSRKGTEFKYHLILIDKAYDEGSTRTRLDFEDDAARGALASYQGITEHLLNALVAKKMLSTDDADQIRKAADEEAWGRHHSFNEAEDVDTLR